LKVKPKGKLVRKSNVLVRSQWSVTSIWEPRLVALLASKIRIEDEDFKTYTVSMDELLEWTGQQRSGRLYDELVSSVEKMLKYPIKLQNENGETVLCNIFAQCTISPKEGLIKLSFAEALKPYYLQLKKDFTLYTLEEFLKLPSIYSQRLFEILTSWRNIQEGEVTIKMGELHKSLDTPPSFKKDFKAFRIRVLEQAQKDISSNPNSSLSFEWQAIKGGRGGKVVSIRFIFDVRKIEQEKRRKEDEERNKIQNRNNAIWMAARKCHSAPNASLLPDEEVCEYCQKFFHPLRDCQGVRRIAATDQQADARKNLPEGLVAAVTI
jgi:plasmid replication initiation protein